jgi:hypothetical protein
VWQSQQAQIPQLSPNAIVAIAAIEGKTIAKLQIAHVSLLRYLSANVNADAIAAPLCEWH